MFLSSVRVPSVELPAGRTLMLASQRTWPSSMLHSLTPSSMTSSRSCCRKSRAAAGDGMSGSVTISTSGVPPRLKSTSEYSDPVMRPVSPPACRSFAASSSMWTRSMRQRSFSSPDQ